jgi:cephalosporin hydroxylase
MIKNLFNKIKREARIFKNLIYRRTYINPKLENDVVNQFHKLYYDSRHFGKSFGNTFWMGTRAFKCPLDLWIYQEIIFERKPDLIIECGTAKGASALFLASMCDLANKGEIVTIDIDEDESRPKHNRIKYLKGSTTSEDILKKVEELASGKKEVLVILDSDHSRDHVLSELKLYNKFVNKGGYLIVEDTNLNGHPVIPNFGPGPMEAVQEFMKENKDFIVDKDKEKFYLTFNPNGFLKRVR